MKKILNLFCIKAKSEKELSNNFSGVTFVMNDEFYAMNSFGCFAFGCLFVTFFCSLVTIGVFSVKLLLLMSVL